jgi:nucleoside-diphosphate-sugar epimerase
VVFASSIAVFGAPFPHSGITDEFHLTPLTSYGTQKAIGELLLADYSRRGFLDGVGIRLPTIVVRPGRPNKAASGFFSGILREPLNGEEAILPVPDTVRHWHASPRAAVGFLLHAATLDTGPLGVRRSLTMPGLCATVGDQIEALRRLAGERAVRLIRREPNADITRMVSGWPEHFRADRAESLGFRAESSFDEILRVYVDDELGRASAGLARIPTKARLDTVEGSRGAHRDERTSRVSAPGARRRLAEDVLDLVELVLELVELR